MTEEKEQWLASVLRQHLVQGLLAVSFGAWSLSLWSTQGLIKQYLTVQNTISTRQAELQTALDALRTDIINERQSRREELLLIRERQDRNTSMVSDHDLRLRNLESHK